MLSKNSLSYNSLFNAKRQKEDKSKYGSKEALKQAQIRKNLS